jgi:multidrug efflux pump subunit AcrA (membrane-fusion protein)
MQENKSSQLPAPRPLPPYEIRSPELQEVMSEIPGSFLKWGILLFFGIVIAILGISWFISSPDLITAPFTVTTYNPPASLVTKAGGKIDRFFVQNGDSIKENQPVALIKNQAHWADILLVEDFLNALADTLNWFSVVNEIIPPSNLFLGELQNPWLNFLNIMRKYKEYTVMAYIPAKIELLDQQIVRQKDYIREMKNQEILSREDLRLTYNSFQRDSNLFHKSSYSISINEFERSKQALIQKQVSFSSELSSIKNTEASILKMKETKLDLSIQQEKETNQFIYDLYESLQILKMSISQWKDKYLVQSPVDGRITYTSYWSENQVISPGEIIATVIPANPERILLRAGVPLSGSGKVKVGQEVNIKLTGYPYMENGILKGRIGTLSLVPVQETYIADIELSNGMRTNFGIELRFINGMTGTAEIITENRRLIYRLIKPLQGILKA